MSSLTVLTPCAPSHLQYLDRCVASVQGQTVRTQHLIKIDRDGRGPGALRNELLQQVQTTFVSFLDADDWLESSYAETLLGAVRPHEYLYTDWYQDAEVLTAPDCAWTQRTYHLVTALVPTVWAREVGGFDEHLPGMEDTDFYVKLVTSGRCGRRYPVPLVHYEAHGGRADAIHRSGEYERLQAEMTRRYGGKRVGCCGDNTTTPALPVGERQPGDVLAQAQWGGNRKEYGRATGRRYPRTSYPHTCWVDPRDIAASPQLWREVIEEPAPKA